MVAKNYEKLAKGLELAVTSQGKQIMVAKEVGGPVIEVTNEDISNFISSHGGQISYSQKIVNEKAVWLGTFKIPTMPDYLTTGYSTKKEHCESKAQMSCLAAIEEHLRTKVTFEVSEADMENAASILAEIAFQQMAGSGEQNLTKAEKPKDTNNSKSRKAAPKKTARKSAAKKK